MPDIYSIADAAIAANANVKASKVQNRYEHVVSQTGTVAAQTEYLHVCRTSGVINTVEATITETVATGADRTVTVDLQKSTGAGAFATVLSAVITFNNGSVARVVSAGTVTSSSLSDNDLLRVVVAVAGAAGAQALGLLVTVVTTFDGM